MSKRHAKIAIMLFAFCSLLCAGCVDGDIRTFVKYGPKDDSFRCMEIYTNLYATEKKDSDHMESLWERRQSIIFYINPFDFQLFRHSAVERKRKNKYCFIDLGSPAEKEPEVKVTSVDLDTTKVIPGEFYLNAHRNLSYYHQIVVPGKTVDALLKEASPSLAEGMAQLAERQIQLAGKEKVKRLTWDGVRKRALEEMFEKDGPKGDPKKEEEGEELMPLEMASLRLLIKAGADKYVKISRNRDTFTLVVPLSKRDCHEAIATVDLIRDTVAERIKAGKPVVWYNPEVLESFKLRYVEGAGLQVSADITRLAKAKTVDINPQPDEKKKVGYKTTVASIQGRGIEINKTFSIKELVAEYVGK